MIIANLIKNDVKNAVSATWERLFFYFLFYINI